MPIKSRYEARQTWLSSVSNYLTVHITITMLCSLEIQRDSDSLHHGAHPFIRNKMKRNEMKVQ